MILHLSPDRGFLTPTLYDLQKDPAVEIAEQQKKANELLVAGDPPFRGSKNAAVTVVEFADFECPFCSRMNGILKDLVADDKSGNIRIVYRNFPLSMHPWAKMAAEITGCAGFQSEALFWQAHDFIYEHQRTLSLDTISDQVRSYLAQQPGFDKEQYASCVSRELSLGVIMKDLALGRQLGVHGTPTLFVNGAHIPGVRDASQLKTAIDAVVHGQQPETGTNSAIVGTPTACSKAAAQNTLPKGGLASEILQ